jgi:hypothetical protein
MKVMGLLSESLSSAWARMGVNKAPMTKKVVASVLFMICPCLVSGYTKIVRRKDWARGKS